MLDCNHLGEQPIFFSVKDTCRTLALLQSVENYAFVLMLRREGGHAA